MSTAPSADLFGGDLFGAATSGTQGTPRTPLMEVPADFELAHVIRDGAFLVNRYVRTNR